LVDIDAAQRAAKKAIDHAGLNDLRRLLSGYFWERLRSKSPGELDVYLSALQVWNREGQACVFKTADEPCAAYTALVFDEGVCVVVLGACYRYPVSAANWWRSVIRPRL
jgi:hypothetical protein